jgi:glycyl-tRNA synthetase
VREFEQMEMEFFVPPDEAEQWYRYWVEQRHRWYIDRRARKRCGCANTRDRSAHSQRDERHQASPIGWQELEGVANRGDFDLTQHTKASGRSSNSSGRKASAIRRT